MKSTQVNTIKELADKYDLFLVDLWGVIHDGEKLYPGVIDCLKYLKQQQKRVLFISNAPKRAFLAKQMLDKLNLTVNLYYGLITSGEVTYDYIVSDNHKLGMNYFIINEQEKDLLDGSGYKNVSDIKEADFVLAIGFKDHHSTLEEITPILHSALERNLPLICANPDLIIIDQNDIKWLCAGVIAKKYEELGGNVTYFGKPYSHIYEKAFAITEHPYKNQIAIIGDNINTDIYGGNLQNIDSYLVLSGIHAKELNNKNKGLSTNNNFEIFFNKHNIYPTGVLESFSI